MNFIIDNLNIIRDQYLSILPKLELASFIISALLLGGIIYILFKFGYLAEKTDFWSDVLVGAGRHSRRQVSRGWKRILKLTSGGNAGDWRTALTGADDILDELLKLADYQGNNLEERLANISPAQLNVIKDLRDAHQLVRRLRREPDYLPSKETVDEAVYAYGQAFRELRLLD